MNINKKSFMAIAFTASTALALSACGSDADPQPATATAEAGDTAAESAVESASSTAAQSAESSSAEETTTEPTESTETTADAEGNDPVFAALGAIMGQYPEAVVVSIDREDDTETYEVEAIEGTDAVELKVDASNGNIIEEDREQNEDEANRIANVNVAVNDAIQQALDQHPDGVLDEAELEEEGENIEWQIDLDDAERNDLAEVRITAS